MQDFGCANDSNKCAAKEPYEKFVFSICKYIRWIGVNEPRLWSFRYVYKNCVR